VTPAALLSERRDDNIRAGAKSVYGLGSVVDVTTAYCEYGLSGSCRVEVSYAVRKLDAGRSRGPRRIQARWTGLGGTGDTYGHGVKTICFIKRLAGILLLEELISVKLGMLLCPRHHNHHYTVMYPTATYSVNGGINGAKEKQTGN